MFIDSCDVRIFNNNEENQETKVVYWNRLDKYKNERQGHDEVDLTDLDFTDQIIKVRQLLFEGKFSISF